MHTYHTKDRKTPQAIQKAVAHLVRTSIFPLGTYRTHLRTFFLSDQLQRSKNKEEGLWWNILPLGNLLEWQDSALLPTDSVKVLRCA
jgi:hypothetical protein